MEGDEWSKVKYSQVGIHWEVPLNIELNNNNERQDSKIGTVCRGWDEGD
jgi:hypothetical protein